MFYSLPREKIKPYGPGWAWDDESYSFQVERSVFPIFGNRVYFEKTDSHLSINPSTFQGNVTEDFRLFSIKKSLGKNKYSLNPESEYFNETRSKPFHSNDTINISILSENLGREIKIIPEVTDSLWMYKYSIATDSAFALLLMDSDNFVAEQLLLQTSFILNGNFNIKKSIDILKKEYLKGLPDEVKWIDGSGLSRYNLTTPRNTVFILENIYRLNDWQKILGLFPAGGINGTIEDYYAADQAFVYAKTGTLSNKHCLSGYMITNSDTKVVFSIMAKDFMGDSHKIKKAIEKMLFFVRENY